MNKNYSKKEIIDIIENTEVKDLLFFPVESKGVSTSKRMFRAGIKNLRGALIRKIKHE